MGLHRPTDGGRGPDEVGVDLRQGRGEGRVVRRGALKRGGRRSRTSVEIVLAGQHLDVWIVNPGEKNYKTEILNHIYLHFL